MPGLRDVIRDARLNVAALESGAIAQPLIGIADVSPELVGASLPAAAAVPITVAPTVDDQAAAGALELEAPADLPVVDTTGPPGPPGPPGPGITPEQYQELKNQIAQLQELAIVDSIYL
jgi:hypothetical protein